MFNQFQDLKIIHFDCTPIEKKYQKKSSHIYISENIQTYLETQGSFEADVVTGFVYSNFTKEVLGLIKGLKLVVTRSAGMDNIDAEFCEENSIKYTNVDYPSHNIAHHTMALILFFTRQLQTFYTTVKEGKFSDRNINGIDLKSVKLGIIGHGRIGKQVNELAQAFGIQVLVYDREQTECSLIDRINKCDLDSILENSDIISLHCDANPTSIGMINEKAIKKMKNGVILINTARGSIINEKDLLKNIKKFSFVGIDVLENENTFSKNHPFLRNPNIFITPHIAYKSEDTTKQRWEQTYKHIEEFIH